MSANYPYGQPGSDYSRPPHNAPHTNGSSVTLQPQSSGGIPHSHNYNRGATPSPDNPQGSSHNSRRHIEAYCPAMNNYNSPRPSQSQDNGQYLTRDDATYRSSQRQRQGGEQQNAPRDYSNCEHRPTQGQGQENSHQASQTCPLGEYFNDPNRQTWSGMQAYQANAGGGDPWTPLSMGQRSYYPYAQSGFPQR
ncbi:hypothetical protein FQN57_006478 [Myotisia sp. PD_48]|nr:hypothetical protein FQN57_006478 [Myotisia sp. PD_48]